jgi:hypothetical protein
VLDLVEAKDGSSGRSPIDGDATDSTDGASLLAACYGASVQGMIAFGPKRGRRVARIGRFEATGFPSDRRERCVESHGFSLHADVRVPSRARERLEKLCRYVLRPPIAQDRLSLTEDGRVAYEFRRAWSDGTRAVVFEPLTFLEKLAALVPPPRVNLVGYHGVLAPNASMRREIVPAAGGRTPRKVRPQENCAPRIESGPPEEGRRYSWAELLRRTFKIDILRCPACGGRRIGIAVITQREVIRKILVSMGLPTEPPAVHRDRPPPPGRLDRGPGAPPDAPGFFL